MQKYSEINDEDLRVLKTASIFQTIYHYSNLHHIMLSCDKKDKKSNLMMGLGTKLYTFRFQNIFEKCRI